MPSRSARMLISLACAPALLLLPLGAAQAATRPTPPLTPDPPDYYTCTTNGAGTYCSGRLVEAYGPEPTGLICGQGPSSIEILDQAVRTVDQERWYDRSGLLTSRKRVITFTEARLSTSGGASVEYEQRDIERISFPVPGDESVAVDTVNSSFRATVPGQGTVLLDKGRVVYGVDADEPELAGRHDVYDAFTGDGGTLEGLCAALDG